MSRQTLPQFLSTALLTDRRPGTSRHADCSALGTWRISMDFFNMHVFRVWRSVGEWFPTFRRDMMPSSSMEGSANTHPHSGADEDCVLRDTTLCRRVSDHSDSTFKGAFAWGAVHQWSCFHLPMTRDRPHNLKSPPQGQGNPTLHRTTFYVRSLNTHLAAGKAVPLQAWTGPEGSRKSRFPDFVITAQDGGKVVSLTHRPPLPPGNTPGTHFC